jgi:DNA-binding IclR family transcriptional regulator
MLQGLTEVGYVQRDEDTGRYRLGLSLLGLAGPLLAELDVRRAAVPHLESLTATTGETSAVSVWNGTNAIVVEQAASPHLVKHSATIGTRYNRFASSSVRVFLAHLSPDRVERIIAGRVILIDDDMDVSNVEAVLSEVREYGYSVNDGDTTDEEYGVSVPVWDYRNEIAGCVTVSAPRSRVLQLHSQDVLTDAALTAAGSISARLGWPGSKAA